jgi:FtsH-binding integral membrane protein
MRIRISRPVAYAALIVYSGLMSVLSRRYSEAFGFTMIALIVATGLCLSALVTYIAQSEPPK